jgi:hypothetical protein
METGRSVVDEASEVDPRSDLLQSEPGRTVEGPPDGTRIGGEPEPAPARSAPGNETAKIIGTERQPVSHEAQGIISK